MKTWRDLGIELPDSFSGEKYATCPQCSPHRKKKKAKCLSANGDKGVWNCQHCGWSGSLKQGVRSKSNPNWWKEGQYAKPKFRETDLPQKVVDWFAKRGIPEKVLKNKKIAFGKAWMPQEEDYVETIQFPYRRDGKVVNVKYRSFEKKQFRQEVNAEKIVYNLDTIRAAKQFWITEGEIDALSWELLELSAISVPDGAPAPNTKDYSSKFEYLECIEEHIERAERIYLAVDNDEAGKRLEEELARRIGREKCWLIRYPDGCKDSNEVVVNYGADILHKCYENAEPYPVQGLLKTKDFEEYVFELYRKGYKKGQSTGWENVDKLWKVREGELTILTGIPGSGKGTIINQMLLNLSMGVGWRHAMFTPENRPLQRFIGGLAETYVRKPFNSGYKERISEAELKQAIEFIDDHFFYIQPNDGNVKLDNLLALSRVAVFRNGVKTVILDPWNEIDHTRPPGMNETEFVSQCLSQMRSFTRSYDVHLILVAHPTKLTKLQDKINKGNYPVPTPYSISGSAHFFNQADNCLAVWRDFENNNGVVELHVQKIRFKELGRLGKAQLRWERLTSYVCDYYEKPKEARTPYKDDSDTEDIFTEEESPF